MPPTGGSPSADAVTGTASYLSRLRPAWKDGDARESHLPASGRTTLSNSRCTVETVEIPGGEDSGRFALLLSGVDAESLVTSMPVC